MNTVNIIRDQIGNRALFMLGAKDLLDTGNGLQFKIGRNGKGVTHIRVELLPSDTYEVTFLRVRRSRRYVEPTVTELEKVSGVYVDSLHATIERATELRTSLGTMGQATR